MTGLADIVFLRPLWVLAVPVALALMVLSLRRSARLGDWQSGIAPHLLTAMTSLGRIEAGRGHLTAALPFVVAAFVAVALSGPAVERRGAQTFRNLDGVVFVMDVSGSMTRDASWPAVVNMARAGLSQLGSRPAALIVYAGDSYLASPLTADHLQLGQSVSLLDDATVPDLGNRPTLALRMAADVLEDASILSGEVVLMTDGAGVSPDTIRAAERIAGLGASLSVVSAPTTVPGEYLPTFATLETLAHVGNGAVYTIGDVATFMRDLKSGARDRLQRQDLKLLLLFDYGRYLLILALLPALLFFRRESV